MGRFKAPAPAPPTPGVRRQPMKREDPSSSLVIKFDDLVRNENVLLAGSKFHSYKGHALKAGGNRYDPAYVKFCCTLSSRHIDFLRMQLRRNSTVFMSFCLPQTKVLRLSMRWRGAAGQGALGLTLHVLNFALPLEVNTVWACNSGEIGQSCSKHRRLG